MGDSLRATAQDNLCLFSSYSSIHFIEKTKFTSLKKENMKIETDRSINYSSLSKGSKVSLSNTSMKRYDAQTMNDRYGNQWRSYASTVREVEQPDGTILKEYVFENPRSLRKNRPSVDLTSSMTSSDDDQTSSREKFAKIKEKFERRSSNHQTSSPSSSSSMISNQIHSRRRDSTKSINESINTRKKELSLSRERDTIRPQKLTVPPSPLASRRKLSTVSNSSTVNNEHSKNGTNRQKSLADGNEGKNQRPPRPIVESIPVVVPNQSSVSKNQYEVTDEYGNAVAIDGIEEIIKLSGIEAREVVQPDGTILKEYVIDNPNVLSQVQTKKLATTFQPSFPKEHIPPPPPRATRPPVVLPAVASMVAPSLPINIQNLTELIPEKQYDFVASSGRRLQFYITELDMTPTNVTTPKMTTVDTHLPLSSSSTKLNLKTTSPMPLQNLWQPMVDSNQRQRTTSGTQFIMNPQPGNPEPLTTLPNDLMHSIPSDQDPFENGQFPPVMTEPIIDWSILRQQDPEGQVDPELVRQFIHQRHQQESAQLTAQLISKHEKLNRQDPMNFYGYPVKAQVDTPHIPTQIPMMAVNGPGPN